MAWSVSLSVFFCKMYLVTACKGRSESEEKVNDGGRN